MKRTLISLAAFVILAVSVLSAFLFSQRRHREVIQNRPPAARTESEARILGVLDRVLAENEVYFEVPASTGRMLRLLTEAVGAKNVVEIGTSTGHSGLWFSLGLQATGGKLTTFEIDATRATKARQHFQEAGVADQVEIVLGDAHEEVKRLKDPMDVVFLDADKEGYTSYLRELLPLVRLGGLILVDNISMAQDYYQAVTTDPTLDTVAFGSFSVTLKKR